MGQGNESGVGAGEPRKSPQSAAELLERYAAGERDFRRARLEGADLTGANLTSANLRDANLIEADLTRVNLCNADLRGAFLKGAMLFAANLADANLSGAELAEVDLRSANLIEADLRGTILFYADLSGSTLVSANLREANLREANLDTADLRGANLSGANLSGANLLEANLRYADLSGANLSGADLGDANLSDAKLSDAIVRGVRLGATSLIRTDVTALCEADPPVVHEGVSTIDHITILRSLRAPKLKEFLAHAGMPEVVVDYMVECAQSIDGSVIKSMLQSTFISYGGPDEKVARQVYEALHRNGVRVFFFPEHAKLGKPLHRVMRDGVNQHDRMLLICSKYSLDRPGVLNEIEEALRREAKQGGEMLVIPIALDDYLFKKWNPPDPGTAETLRLRVVGDFKGAKKDPAKFQAGMLKLIAALRKTPGPLSLAAAAGGARSAAAAPPATAAPAKKAAAGPAPAKKVAKKAGGTPAPRTAASTKSTATPAKSVPAKKAAKTTSKAPAAAKRAKKTP